MLLTLESCGRHRNLGIKVRKKLTLKLVKQLKRAQYKKLDRWYANRLCYKED